MGGGLRPTVYVVKLFGLQHFDSVFKRLTAYVTLANSSIGAPIDFDNGLLMDTLYMGFIE